MSGPPNIPPLDSTLGAVEIGGIVSTFLLGIETLQVYHYFRKYPDDSWFLKSMVVAVWTAELADTISSWHATYAMTVTFYAQFQHLEAPPHSIEMTIFFSSFVYLVVQSFFANRVRVFSGRWLIPVICWAMIIFKVASNLAMMALAWVHPNILFLQVQYRWLMATALGFELTTNTVITLSMCYWLWTVRQSRFERTKRMIDTLLVWTVETGMATCFTCGMFLILFLTRDDLTWFPFFLVQAKLYSNSFFIALNGRQRLRESGRILDISSGSTTRGLSVPEGNRGLVIQMSKMVETETSVSKDLEGGHDLRG
ncbi:hypothetical protein C8R45DRAFT_990867 [Mycena sanguinolenta]|nr:hypothetical protein C8R45DRAFT_990867 [Mycena sanguinolenta]